MASLSFFLLFFLQMASGYPFLLPFLFWHGVFSLLLESIFWSALGGIAFGMILGNFWYWLGIALTANLFLQFLNRFVVQKKTPLILSLLFLAMIILWHIPGLAGSPRRILLLFFPLSFLFFFFHAFWIHKVARQQKRLF